MPSPGGIGRWFEAMAESGQFDFESPYAAGFDCGKNGENTRNCHFIWFSEPGRTAEWERGKAEAEAQKGPSP